jgi:hypothetical protein
VVHAREPRQELRVSEVLVAHEGHGLESGEQQIRGQVFTFALKKLLSRQVRSVASTPTHTRCEFTLLAAAVSAGISLVGLLIERCTT